MSERGAAAAALAEFRRLGLRPKRSFGQSFLADARTARAVADLCVGPGGGTVVEIGAGLGALTEPLCDRAARVVAIERDRDLVPILARAFAEHVASGRLRIVEADAAAADLAGLAAEGPAPRAVGGNLPYQITGMLLEAVVGVAPAIDRAVVMVQREVADRLVASPGTPAYGALTVFVRAAFRVRRALSVRRGTFRPAPEVDSSVVVLEPERPARAEETDAFRSAVRAAFAQRRKTLRNAWAGVGPTFADVERAARDASIDLGRRGETLDVEEFARFASALRGA